jgi:phosphoglucomutase
MNAQLHPLAGLRAPPAMLADIPRLLADYDDLRPDPGIAAQRVAFGTSGHRGNASNASFNAWHVLAIVQAICDYRARRGINGPLFLGIDTHALSQPALASALEVLAANGVAVRVAPQGEYTPTPAVSHAILRHNRGRSEALGDGIVITPSHNPPESGGIKYNLPHGGPASSGVTQWIEARANALLQAQLQGVQRLPLAQALTSGAVQTFDFREAYVADLGRVLDFDAIRASGLRLAVDPLGGAGVHYWGLIGERYRIELELISTEIDPTFSFMALDWDGRIRMDPSSRFVMAPLIEQAHRFDLTLACDTDHDRHGIVTRDGGLLATNHYHCVAIDYLLRERPRWPGTTAIGKTVVGSVLIDRVVARHGRKLLEMPVGFKWFVDDLFDGTLGFAGEESAGASFSRMDGKVWTTDKDGIAVALLAAEICARSGRTLDALYRSISAELGAPSATRIDAAATPAQKQQLAQLSARAMAGHELAGEPIIATLDRAPGNDALIGGIKVVTANAWFAARPSGTEDVYKIYAESFLGDDHLQAVLVEAQALVDGALAAPGKE